MKVNIAIFCRVSLSSSHPAALKIQGVQFPGFPAPIASAMHMPIVHQRQGQPTNVDFPYVWVIVITQSPQRLSQRLSNTLARANVLMKQSFVDECLKFRTINETKPPNLIQELMTLIYRCRGLLALKILEKLLSMYCKMPEKARVGLTFRHVWNIVEVFRSQ